MRAEIKQKKTVPFLNHICVAAAVVCCLVLVAAVVALLLRNATHDKGIRRKIEREDDDVNCIGVDEKELTVLDDGDQYSSAQQGTRQALWPRFSLKSCCD